VASLVNKQEKKKNVFFSLSRGLKKTPYRQKDQKESCNGNKIDSLSKLRWHFPFPVNYSFNYTASCDSLIPNKLDSVGRQS